MTEAEAAPETTTKTDDASPPSRALPPPSRALSIARRALREWDRVLAVLASAVLALSFGFDYGADNQLIYLLKSLAIANPGILEKDWYASEVTHYHPVFAWLGAGLIALNRDGWAVAIAQVLLITVATTFIYETLRAVAPKRVALAGFLCALPLMIMTRTSSVAVSYAFDAYLQPSGLGSLGLLGAIAMFVRGNFLASGIWIGVAGLFHANYLVLSIPTFGLMHLFLGVKGLPRRLLSNLGPLMIAAIPAFAGDRRNGHLAGRGARAGDPVLDPLPAPLLAGPVLQGAGTLRGLADVRRRPRLGAVPRPEHAGRPLRHRPRGADGPGLDRLGVLDRRIRAARRAAVRVAIRAVHRHAERGRGLPGAGEDRRRARFRATRPRRRCWRWRRAVWSWSARSRPNARTRSGSR